MKQLNANTAIKAWLALMLFWMAGVSWAAQVAGTVVQLSGPLMAKKADGAVRILSMRSEVESGDTLMTEKNTYAMVKFIDNSEITLKPSTTFKVENFSYDADKPDGDKASFNLVKGGLRSVTGLLGKRNKEKFEMKTPSATIGIRGTTFVVEWIEPPARAVAAAEREAYLMASTAALDPLAAPLQPLMLAQGPVVGPVQAGTMPGLNLYVISGAIFASNGGGMVPFNAGQFGYVPPGGLVPPMTVPSVPNMDKGLLNTGSVLPSLPPGASSTGGARNQVNPDEGCIVR